MMRNNGDRIHERGALWADSRSSSLAAWARDFLRVRALSEDRQEIGVGHLQRNGWPAFCPLFPPALFLWCFSAHMHSHLVCCPHRKVGVITQHSECRHDWQDRDCSTRGPAFFPPKKVVH